MKSRFPGFRISDFYNFAFTPEKLINGNDVYTHVFEVEVENIQVVFTLAICGHHIVNQNTMTQASYDRLIATWESHNRTIKPGFFVKFDVFYDFLALIQCCFGPLISTYDHKKYLELSTAFLEKHFLIKTQRKVAQPFVNTSYSKSAMNTEVCNILLHYIYCQYLLLVNFLLAPRIDESVTTQICKWIKLPLTRHIHTEKITIPFPIPHLSMLLQNQP